MAGPAHPPDGLVDDLDGSPGPRWAGLILTSVLALWLLSAPVLLIWWERPITGPRDEFSHVVFFAMLTLTGLGVALNRPRQRAANVVVIAGAILLAVVTEAAQAWLVSARSGSFKDVALNLTGIALGLASFWAVRAITGPRARAVLAGVSVLAFIVTGVVGVSMTIRESTWWRCRGVVPANLEHSYFGVSPGPELELDVVRGVWMWQGGEVPIAEPAPQAAASAAWCAAMESNEFTLMVAIRPEMLSNAEEVVVLATPLEPDRGAFNFELVLEPGSIAFRYRTGPSDRFPHWRVRDVLPSHGTVLFALRRADDELAVFVDGDEVRSPQALFPVSSWDPRAVLITGPDDQFPAHDGLLHVAFFGRGLADAELRR